ncbi:MAG: FAD-dependent oxidoreductase, partial [Planctomycetota bacterium]|nr:FAD-dependent oxidoreductase [Planctomycetota bacterium]
MKRKIVIVGGGTAGASAAFAARMKDKDAEITVLTEEKYPTYSRCALPFAISGQVKSLEKCIVFDESKFKAQRITLLKA